MQNFHEPYGPRHLGNGRHAENAIMMMKCKFFQTNKWFHQVGAKWIFLKNGYVRRSIHKKVSVKWNKNKIPRIWRGEVGQRGILKNTLFSFILLQKCYTFKSVKMRKKWKKKKKSWSLTTDVKKLKFKASYFHTCFKVCNNDWWKKNIDRSLASFGQESFLLNYSGGKL